MRHPPPWRKKKSAPRAKKNCRLINAFSIDTADRADCCNVQCRPSTAQKAVYQLLRFGRTAILPLAEQIIHDLFSVLTFKLLAN